MNDYLTDARKLFGQTRALAEKAIAQVPDEKLNWAPNAESNSVAVIVKHMCGNMLSRWTDFLTSDGEKEWRNRDQEFEGELNRQELMELWERGWRCLSAAVDPLQEADLQKTVMIRNEPHSVMMAINRQLLHYAYHVGQIVFVAKAVTPEGGWQSLSVPRGASAAYNAKMFGRK